jgi:hypothetical protein
LGPNIFLKLCSQLPSATNDDTASCLFPEQELTQMALWWLQGNRVLETRSYYYSIKISSPVKANFSKYFIDSLINMCMLCKIITAAVTVLTLFCYKQQHANSTAVN